MVECISCHQVDYIVRAGFVRGRQRFLCKACSLHFTLPVASTRKVSKSPQPTQSDIATALGISVSTVSRALQGHTDIHPNTRQAVMELAAQLDYQPNTLAVSLIRNRTSTIGVLIPDIERPFFASMVSGIQHVATPAGYRVMICQSDESYATEVSNIQALVSSRVDGLLVCQTKQTTVYDHFQIPIRRNIPLVFFDRICAELDTTQIVLDNVESARKVVAHLIERGCRRIAILTGPAQLLISRERLKGYELANQQAGLPIDERLISYGQFNQDTAQQAAYYWMRLQPPPDAIFSAYDMGAVHIMQLLKQSGWSVPGDIRVAGMGNEPMSALIDPPLTTLHQFPAEIGQMAARLLLQQIATEETVAPSTHVIKGELIIRKSTH